MQTHEIEEQGSVCLNEKVKISKTMQPSPKQNYKEVECMPNQFKKRQCRWANLSDALADKKKLNSNINTVKPLNLGPKNLLAIHKQKNINNVCTVVLKSVN